MADDQPYDVGYGKPPRQTRFKPGQSGNPRGRPRKGQSVLDLIERELDEKITINQQGCKKQIRKREAVAKTFVNGLVKGGAASNYRTYFEMIERRRAEAEYRELMQMEEAAQLEEDDQPITVTLDMGDPEIQFRIAKAHYERSLREQGKELPGSEEMPHLPDAPQ